jgi:hypothetical protein
MHQNATRRIRPIRTTAARTPCTRKPWRRPTTDRASPRDAGQDPMHLSRTAAPTTDQAARRRSRQNPMHQNPTPRIMPIRATVARTPCTRKPRRRPPQIPRVRATARKTPCTRTRLLFPPKRGSIRTAKVEAPCACAVPLAVGWHSAVRSRSFAAAHRAAATARASREQPHAPVPRANQPASDPGMPFRPASPTDTVRPGIQGKPHAPESSTRRRNGPWLTRRRPRASRPPAAPAPGRFLPRAPSAAERSASRRRKPRPARCSR